MLTKLIKDDAGYDCQTCADFEEFKNKFGKNNDKCSSLLLWDYHNGGLNEFWQEYQNIGNFFQDLLKVAVFNAPVRADVGLQVLRNGGHGVFYQKDSPDIFLKGVKAILKGDIWISRDVANKFIRKIRDRSSMESEDLLTRREKEIMAFLPSGATNEEIAGALSISPHTVRTHLSNIYGKLSMANRFQAALWASEHL
jgi:LuxR family transcriptional regulator of csgAB operon